MNDTSIRNSDRINNYIDVKLTGMHQEAFAFTGFAVGISVNGMGIRSKDPVLNCATLELLMRQAFRVKFQIEGIEFSDIICKILRLERSRKDPTKDYFIAIKFIQISDIDELNLQTYIKFYNSKKAE